MLFHYSIMLSPWGGGKAFQIEWEEDKLTPEEKRSQEKTREIQNQKAGNLLSALNQGQIRFDNIQRL